MKRITWVMCIAIISGGIVGSAIGIKFIRNARELSHVSNQKKLAQEVASVHEGAKEDLETQVMRTQSEYTQETNETTINIQKTNTQEISDEKQGKAQSVQIAEASPTITLTQEEGQVQQKGEVSCTLAPAKQEVSTLRGKIICIDAGHQSKGSNEQEPIAPGSTETKARVSSGTKGVASGKYEYELNLEVAMRLKAALVAKGAIVHMVREVNEVDISNVERAELANKVGADLSIRIHADGSSDSSVNGFSILVPGGSYVSETVIKESYSIAECVESYLAEGIPNVSRGIVTRTDLTGFNWSKVPSILIEMGFMSNPEEDLRMCEASFQEDFVTSLVESLEAYYKPVS